MLCMMKMPLKGRLDAVHLIVIEITLLIMEKSWNCVFEFLWEPCNICAQAPISVHKVLYGVFTLLFKSNYFQIIQ